MRERVARRLDPFADVGVPEHLHGEPVGVARIASGGGGCGSFSDARMPTSASLACWLGIVRLSTVSSRSRQNGPLSFTSANGTGEKPSWVMINVSVKAPAALRTIP